MGPYLFINAFLAGFFAFGAVYHFILWTRTRREWTLLAFAVVSMIQSIQAVAVLLVAVANTTADGEFALNLRTVGGATNVAALAWLLAIVSGFRPRWYLWTCTTILLAGVVYSETVAPMTGAVIGVERTLTAWGESISVLQRSPPSVWLGPVYVAAGSVPIFGLVAAWSMWRSDRFGSALLTLTALGYGVSIVVGALIDFEGMRLPYVGPIVSTIWVLPIAWQVARANRQRDLALASTERRFRAIFDQTFQFVGLLEVDGTVLEANQTALTFAGVTLHSVVGKPFWDTPWWSHSTELQERLRDAIALAGGGRIVRFEATHPDVDGRLHAIDFSLKPVFDDRGAVILLIPEGRDITERKHAERQLIHSQKMEALGQLAGGVAHDFNNLLMVIAGHTDLLLLGSDQSRHDLEQIRLATERAAAMTRQLLAFSRRSVLEPRVVNINTVVKQSESMLRSLSAAIEIVVDPADDVRSVKGDPDQLARVLLNVAINARDAMPDGGTLAIQTRNVVMDETVVGGHTRIPPGEYVLLAISDTGVGMTPETRSRLFEPFFTTKGHGKGTGLGLAVVDGVVKQSGGYIDVYSEIGHGTTFKIYLPAVESERRSDERAESGEPARGTETILLVEDEPAVREVAQEVLKRRGYTVLSASDATEALRIARDNAGRIDLVLTDVVMPGMTGPQLVERLRAEQPNLPALFMSGYTSDSVLRNEVATGDASFLQKPFSTGVLAAKLRQVLDHASRQGG
jgi:PAS domain S-box-containing protein